MLIETFDQIPDTREVTRITVPGWGPDGTDAEVEIRPMTIEEYDHICSTEQGEDVEPAILAQTLVTPAVSKEQVKAMGRRIGMAAYLKLRDTCAAINGLNVPKKN